MTKYTDNKLAEDYDFIVAINRRHEKEGLKKGALGILIESYTHPKRPLYGLFLQESGHQEEFALSLKDFRVLDIRVPSDLQLILSYVNAKRARTAV